MSKNAEKVQVESRAAWRDWLKANHTQKEGIWLITFKKHVSDKHISWNDIVEEALCFGWIDSLPRKLDEDRTMLYISPRKKKSPWSRKNKNHIEKLLAEGLMAEPGLKMIEEAKADGSWTIYDEVEDMIIPADLETALDANPTAKGYWERFPDSVVKGILWWIKSAKREETRAKRIAETVTLAEQNIRANQPRQPKKSGS